MLFRSLTTTLFNVGWVPRVSREWHNHATAMSSNLKKKQATITLKITEKTTGEGKWWFRGGGRGGENMAKKNSQQTPREETHHTVHV